VGEVRQGHFRSTTKSSEKKKKVRGMSVKGGKVERDNLHSGGKTTQKKKVVKFCFINYGSSEGTKQETRVTISKKGRGKRPEEDINERGGLGIAGVIRRIH